MNISMYRTAKSLELVKVEVYDCYILCSYLLLRKTLILRNKINNFLNINIPYHLFFVKIFTIISITYIQFIFIVLIIFYFYIIYFSILNFCFIFLFSKCLYHLFFTIFIIKLITLIKQLLI